MEIGGKMEEQKITIGLGIEKTNKQGFVANFARLATLTVDWDNLECSCVFNLYKDKKQADLDSQSFMESFVIATAGDVDAMLPKAKNKFEKGERFTTYMGSEILRGGIKEAFYDMALETEDFFKNAVRLYLEME